MEDRLPSESHRRRKRRKIAGSESSAATMEAEDGLNAGFSRAVEEVSMAVEAPVRGSLRTLGYKGPLVEEAALVGTVALGASCQEFTRLCAWLVSELKTVCHLEEDVNPTTGPEDADTFQLEMSGVLSELCCPYPSLTTGSVTSRLTSSENCLLLLAFLCSELQAAKLLFSRRDHLPEVSEEKASVWQEKGGISEELRLIGEALGLPPAPGTPVSHLLGKVEAKILVALSAVPDGHLKNPLLRTPLEPRQWEELARIHRTLHQEYECRMRMLVTRFDVTVQSFHWSERAKQGQGAAMEELFSPLRKMMFTESQITLAHLLAAREDTSRIVKTSSGTSLVNTACAVNKVLMGSVPDRGGRPSEIEPPMPSWEKRREGGGRGGGGGGRQRSGKRGKKKQ